MDSASLAVRWTSYRCTDVTRRFYWVVGVKGGLAVTCGLLLSGGVLALCGVVGRFDAQYSYCDYSTNPCTQVTAPVWYGERNRDAHFTPGAGLTRTIMSILGSTFLAVSSLVSASALDEEEKVFAQSRSAKVLEAASSALLEKEELEKVAIASQMRVKDFERELTDGYAYLHLERNPHLVEELTFQPDPPVSPEAETSVESRPMQSDAEIETEEPKIPAGIQLMLDSDLSAIVDAGILSLVGSQGSGKTTSSCMMLRYRIWKGHKLIIVNPHKRKSMYKGIEPFLLPGTTIYGVGMGDAGRASSLLKGLETVLALIEKRYDEYQNLDESEYDHFPVTILLEECAEYDGLLSVFNRPANPKAEDPGFSAKKWLTSFWKKIFVATRKGNSYLIRTLQADTNTMNGTEGLAKLIQASGACTLTQFSTPDGGCIGGWRSTGLGEMKIPNQKHIDSDGNAQEAKPVTVPTYWDYCKILKDITDFSTAFSGSQLPKVKCLSLVPIPEEKESISLPESLTENPEDLWQRAVQHLNKSLTADSQVKNANFPPSNREGGDTKNHLETTETTIPNGEQSSSTALTYTPDSLTREQMVTKIQYHQHKGDSQTKTIEILWGVQKNRSGWKQAYKEFKELTK